MPQLDNPVDDESAWRRFRKEWTLPDDVVYLNHGSFGPSPRVVQEAFFDWTRRLESQPMDFFVRRLEEHLDDAAARLGAFIGAGADDLIFTDNATTGMNIVTASVDLAAGDEVLFTDHEYGAVRRIWQRACKRAGAEIVVRPLPDPLESAEQTAEEFLAGVTNRTKLIVVSHVTSPTAAVIPVESICRRARALRVPVCIDGPHAVAMRPLDLASLDCDFYAASCHKWLSAPFGSGFLYVAGRRRQHIEPVVMSWGGSVSGREPHWKNEFNWVGTDNPARYLAIPAAIDFFEQCGIEAFRERTHYLARYARGRIESLTGMAAVVPDDGEWYGSMITLEIPTAGIEPPAGGSRDPLQDALWEQHRIEVPVVHWKSRRFVRVSCHLYNSTDDVDQLVEALRNVF